MTKNYLHEDKHYAFLTYYFDTYRFYLGKGHPRLSENHLLSIRSDIDEIMYDKDFDDWQDAVRLHFDNLPMSNNGNILAFLTAKSRYFGHIPD